MGKSVSQHYVCLEAINPKDGNKFTVKVSRKRMQIIACRGKGDILEMAYILPEVLTKPIAIFEGLRRDKDEPEHDYSSGWLCYVGKPSVAYMSYGKKIAPWQDGIFLAFVNEDKVVYNWRWEKADINDLDLLDEGGKRFRKRLL